MLAGRKRESYVWTYFKYNDEKEKSICIVKNKNGEQCGKEMAGKNTSNLKTHLSRFHGSEYEKVTEEEKKMKTEKPKTEIVPSKTGVASSQRSLQECMWKTQGSVKKWSCDSLQYSERVDVLENFLNDTGYPVSLVNKPCFRAMLTKFDPKFGVPGQSAYYFLHRSQCLFAVSLLLCASVSV